MKAVKSTGLVPATFLKSSGSNVEGETRGLSPKDFKRLQERGIVEAADAPKGVEMVEIDDNSLKVVAMPSLGGYDHYPPLASNLVPGRNRFSEDTDAEDGTPSLTRRVATYEDDTLGRQDQEQAEAKPASNATEAAEKVSPPKPPSTKK